MKLCLCLWAILLISFAVFPQTPEGDLYFHTQKTTFEGKGVLGYITYPDEVIHYIDSSNLSDYTIAGGKIYTADSNTYVYDLSSHNKVDSIPGVSGRQIAVSGTNVVLTSNQHPYFRVFDGQNNYNLLFSLDSSKIPFTPADFSVYDSKAFLLFDSSVVVVDLILQDTIANVITPHPFPFAGLNRFVLEGENYLYIDVEYVTGALRFSLLRMNKTTYEVDTVFHKEGNGNFYRPLLVDDKIYMFGFDSHYDITNDTLVINPSFFPYEPIAVTNDTASGAVFLNYPQQHQLSYFVQGMMSDSLMLPGMLNKAIFVNPSTINAIQEEVINWSIYPNPASDLLYIQLPERVELKTFRITDVSGKIMMEKEVDHASELLIPVDDLTTGVYFLHLVSGENEYTKPFVIE